MPLSVPPRDLTDDDADVRELRLALVCYGGVSLAIYMGGITREIQSLVAASNAYAREQDKNPFERERERDSAYAYWEALKAAEKLDGVRTRVVVDIVAGTSAGGINGVILAKALACEAPQVALRDVWLEQGDIKVLLGSRMPGLALKGGSAALATMFKRRSAPLSGRVMLTQVHKALTRMTPGSAKGAGGDWDIELHVTMTDFFGYPLSAPSWNPKAVKELRHRHHLTFRSEQHELDTSADWALAFAARATSSFPGAFPPVRIADLKEQIGAPDQAVAEFVERYWRPYAVAGRTPQNSVFIDGGVLDNAPFDLAVAALRSRPANVEVDRRLLFIQPDPHDPAAPPESVTPTMVKTVLGGLSTIPRAEPVLEQLLEVHAHNVRVDRAEAVIKEIEGQEAVAVPDDLGTLADENADAHAALNDSLGPAALAYGRVKLYSVLDRLAGLAAEIARLPPESNQAFLIRDVVFKWADGAKLLATGQNAWDNVQRPFLQAFDVGYAERRLRFVIRRLNGYYDGGDRARLNGLKHMLYERLQVLTEAIAVADEAARAPVLELFSLEALAPYMALPDDPDAVAARFVSDRGAALDALHDSLGRHLTDALAGFNEATYTALRDEIAGWPAAQRDVLMSAYLRFPVWDALLFPIGVFGDAGERDRVEVLRVSPLDVGLLKVPPDPKKPSAPPVKLKGVAAGHFGAFFQRPWRENDYLWGRLDAVERLIWLLIGTAPSPSYGAGFAAVLGSEAADGKLTHISALTGDLSGQISRLGADATAQPEGT
jgi:patatin-related protein